jgi:hypothetical protein
MNNDMLHVAAARMWVRCAPFCYEAGVGLCVSCCCGIVNSLQGSAVVGVVMLGIDGSARKQAVLVCLEAC